MKNIPEWIIKVVETDKLHCNKCSKVLGVDDLTSLGIQESAVSPHNDKLCVGLSCPKCKDITIFELKEMSLIEFAFEILDKETEAKKEPESNKEKRDVLRELASDRPQRRKSVQRQSKITKKEVNEVVKFLNDTKTHEDFLVAMGMSPEQISKYNYKKGEEE